MGASPHLSHFNFLPLNTLARQTPGSAGAGNYDIHKRGGLSGVRKKDTRWKTARERLRRQASDKLSKDSTHYAGVILWRSRQTFVPRILQ